MQVSVIPIYGFGWFGSPRTTVIDVPKAFTLDVTIIRNGDAFEHAQGFAAVPGHPLDGMWIGLERRTGGETPSYNLLAYREKPDDRVKTKPFITGFALCEALV